MYTGITSEGNNWLMMATQAANTTKDSCVVCLGPRPILKIVPAILPSNCVIDVMTKTNPSNSCLRWDAVFPLTTHQKKTPIFSTFVAPGNFTCINLTASVRSLGQVNRSWCTIIEQLTCHKNHYSSSQ